MAEQKDSGFNIPAPADSAAPATNTGAVTGQAPAQDGSVLLTPVPVTSARDLVLAGGVLLVLVVVFFIARNAYANMLVSKKVSPRSANAAGWWLYILRCVAAAGNDRQAEADLVHRVGRHGC